MKPLWTLYVRRKSDGNVATKVQDFQADDERAAYREAGHVLVRRYCYGPIREFAEQLVDGREKFYGPFTPCLKREC